MVAPPPLPPLEPAAQATYERALDLLSFRARSARQLEKKLLEKGEPAAHVAAVIARLVANGLLDDARYAEARARAAIVGKGRSRRRAAETLAKDGVAREVADRALQEVLEEAGGDDLAAALRAGEKKLRSLLKLEPRARRDKLYGFLARQGFDADVVRRALRALLDAAPPEEAED